MLPLKYHWYATPAVAERMSFASIIVIIGTLSIETFTETETHDWLSFVKTCELDFPASINAAPFRSDMFSGVLIETPFGEESWSSKLFPKP